MSFFCGSLHVRIPHLPVRELTDVDQTTCKMSSLASQLPVSKSYKNLKAPGLKVKTNFAEPGKYANHRAKAIRAADWRKPTHIMSLSENSRIKGKSRSSDENGEPSASSDISSPLVIEMEDMRRDAVRYHRPKSEQAPWEMISSAPALRSHLSQSAIYDLCLGNTTAVQFKDAKPVVVNVNGEDMVLPNRFTFDITPVNLSDSSSDGSFSGTIGELKRVRDPSQVQCRSSQDPNLFGQIPDDLMALLNHDLASIPEEEASSLALEDTRSSTGSVVRRKTTQPNEAAKPKASAGKIVITEEPQHTCPKLTEEDRTRFQGLLDRLHKKEPQPVRRPAASAFDVRSSDPAILAAKVKEDRVTIRSLLNNEQRQELLDSVHQPRVARHQNSENSRDSGYETGTTTTTNLQLAPINAPPRPAQGFVGDFSHSHQVSMQKLNPTAAEFKSTFRTVDMPVFVPKRLSRPPLSNLFFEAMPAQIAPQPATTPTPVRPPPGFSQPVSDVVVAQAQLPPRDAPNGTVPSGHATSTLVRPPPPPPLGIIDPRTAEVNPLSGMLPGTLPGLYPPMDILSRTLNMTSTVPYSTMLPMSMPTNNFGTFSTSPFVPFPMPGPGPQLGLPNMSPHGTFPPPGGEMALPFVPPPPGFNPINPMTAPVAAPPRPIMVPPPGIPPKPQFGADGKQIRPHFPVTQKPRDHDPVKQQQYEAYLEWRKANEPGYHIRCKMRQANRIVRQHQMKQAEQKVPTNNGEQADNPAWKSIVEKAKAVVATAAAAAAAEKRARGESVREELRAKIKESCSSDHHAEKPAESHAEKPEEGVINKEEK